MAHAHYTVGEGYSSATIQAAIDLVPGDLSDTGGGIRNVDVYYCDADDHSVAYAETLDIYTGFSNGSATDYIDVGAMVSHGGMLDSGIIIDITGATRLNIQLSAYVRFNGFCVTGSLSYAGTTYGIVVNQSSYARVLNNIVYGLTHSGQNINTICLPFVSGVGIKCFNNQVFNIVTTTGKTVYGIYVNNNGSAGNEHEVHNNSVSLTNASGVNERPFQCENATYLNMSNNYASTAVSPGYSIYRAGGANCNINYNISSDGTADDYGGTGNLVSKAAVDQFECVTAGSENLQLRYTSACYRKGQDNSALFTTDCAGNTWNHWETGALAKQYARIYNVDGDEKDQITSNGVIIP